MFFGGLRFGIVVYNVIIDVYGKGKFIDQMEFVYEVM